MHCQTLLQRPHSGSALKLKALYTLDSMLCSEAGVSAFFVRPLPNAQAAAANHGTPLPHESVYDSVVTLLIGEKNARLTAACEVCAIPFCSARKFGCIFFTQHPYIPPRTISRKCLYDLLTPVDIQYCFARQTNQIRLLTLAACAGKGAGLHTNHERVLIGQNHCQG